MTMLGLHCVGLGAVVRNEALWLVDGRATEFPLGLWVWGGD